MSSIKSLPLDEIKTDPRLQVRSPKLLAGGEKAAKDIRLGEMHQRLVNCLESGEELAPIKVIEHKGEYLVFDGHHRLKAYQEVFPFDNRKVPVEIERLTYREALGKGFTVNADHGEGLHSSERSQAALRSCIYSPFEVKAKDLVSKQGISESVSQKVTRAARRLKKEAAISPKDNPNVIDRKVSKWIEELPKGVFSADGKRLFKIDDHGFPTYRFILEKKAGRDVESDEMKIAQIQKTLEGLVDEDYYAFRKALKKVAHSSNRDLRITIHRLGEPSGIVNEDAFYTLEDSSNGKSEDVEIVEMDD